MKMALSLSLEQFTAISNLDPVVKAQGDVCGWNSQYTMDSIVRRYMDKRLTDLYSDIGDLGCVSIELDAGIGTLLLTSEGATFTPLSKVQTEIIHMADTDTQHIRKAQCDVCTNFKAGKCGLAGCSCNGMGNVSRLYSKCPMGHWPK